MNTYYNDDYQINTIIDEMETIKTAIRGLEATAIAMDNTIEKVQASIAAYDKLMELNKQQSK